ncbi:MAG: DUF2281 domain-containing protein [Herpetosiphon sp.]|nr:DUF2281 domain-containing protein [Herpetosiphon sp.]
MNNLETLVRTLPPELQTKVEDFVLFLIHKRQQSTKQAKPMPTFNWAGGLRDEHTTSVELQHEINRCK